MSPQGSSPRVRGKLRCLLPRVVQAGLIPACAGKTRSSRRPARNCPAHPRVCGENLTSTPTLLATRGSSPRVRGKRPPTTRAAPHTGLIPECAGKTAADHAGGTAYRAHPRVCGENLIPVIEALVPVGSSPRVRGKLDEQGQDDAVRGLIPACAGKTTPRRRRARQSRAHPRVCGENSHYEWEGCDCPGSSPRVRGKPRHRTAPRATDGLIPACAGKTTLRPPMCRGRPAHPRVCGENAPFACVRSCVSGSSPRVRGKPPGRPCTTSARAAHPRVCGENSASELPWFGSVGSSPRVRGKRHDWPVTTDSTGLIPACAGKTPP